MPNSAPELLQIGSLQRQSGVAIKTIRYYEALGLIQATRRSQGGFRLFAPTIVTRLSFIKRAQRLGFSLSEIKQILSIHDQGELPCAEVRQQIHTKIAEIDQHIEHLTELKQELLSLVTTQPQPDQRHQGVICPILEQTSN